jgi:hypothetical protein
MDTKELIAKYRELVKNIDEELKYTYGLVLEYDEIRREIAELEKHMEEEKLIEQPAPGKSAEEIRLISKEIYQANYKDYFFANSDEAFHKGIELGVEYRNQPQPEPVAVSAEEWFDNHFDCYTTLNESEDIPALTKSLFIQFASQFQSKPTNEEIEEAAKIFQSDTSTSFNQGMYSGFIFGAQEMRNGKIGKK